MLNRFHYNNLLWLLLKGRLMMSWPFSCLLSVLCQYASEEAELLLVGNKLDCETDRIISRQQGERVRSTHKCSHLTLTSLNHMLSSYESEQIKMSTRKWIHIRCIDAWEEHIDRKKQNCKICKMQNLELIDTFSVSVDYLQTWTLCTLEAHWWLPPDKCV